MKPPFLLLTISIVFCAACASTNTPNQASDNSASAIRAAEEVGATHTPDAALHLQLAKEEFQYAQHLPNPDDKERANRLLRRAQVDAELALALARSDTERNEAQVAIDNVTKLTASSKQ